MARVGLLGGTFNPPHVGAPRLRAGGATSQLGLDRVLLVPAGVPPHKEVEAEPGVEHRVAMCEAAVAGDRAPRRLARGRRPRGSVVHGRSCSGRCTDAAPEDELTFIVGGDMAHSLPAWREPEEVLALARLAVAEREGVRRDDIAERLAGLAGAAERVEFFDMPRIDVSSSLIRRRAAPGVPLRYLVPDAVADTSSARACTRRRLSLGGSA